MKMKTNSQQINMKEDNDIKSLGNDEEEDISDFYEWEMIPKRNSEETKTGVTFKGDTEEYIKAHGMLLKMMDKKGTKYFVNKREIRILDNAKNKPVKVEVKPLKGATGKVNIKIYNVNAKGGATMMISKVSDGKLFHVKTLAFKVVKYLMDGMIDGEIKEEDIENFKLNPDGIETEKDGAEESPRCFICDKVFKTKHGLNIHSAKVHEDVLINFGSNPLNQHMENEHEVIQIFKCDYCDEKFEAENNLKGIQVIKKHHEVCMCKPKKTEIIALIFKCDVCEFKSCSESTLKRHNRDKHNHFSKSISPQPKKRKHTNAKKEGEDMETMDFKEIHLKDNDLTKDGEVYWADARNMSEKENSILLGRSKLQDQKVKKIEERRKIEEKNLIEKSVGSTYHN